MKFIVWRNAANEWMWTLWARNGKKIATAGEGHKRRAHVLRMCARINPDFPVEVKEQP